MQIQNWPFLLPTRNSLFTQICSLHCNSMGLLYLGLGIFLNNRRKQQLGFIYIGKLNTLKRKWHCGSNVYTAKLFPHAPSKNPRKLKISLSLPSVSIRNNPVLCCSSHQAQVLPDRSSCCQHWIEKPAKPLPCL